MTNKFDALKQKYKEWHDAQSPSGLGRDTATGGIAAEPEYWQTQYGLPNDPDDCTEPMVSLLLLILLPLSIYCYVKIHNFTHRLTPMLTAGNK